MAPQIDDRALRSVNYRLKNTPTKQLPKILAHITAQLVAAKCDLSNHTEATWLKTRITSLLQDRTPEGRWSAVVLVKTVLEAGGPNVLFEDKERVGGWIRGLIEILKKPGPVTTKKCAVVAITRAFMLTWEHPTLVRELTTPSLPAYITTCLQQFQTTPLFVTVVQCELVEFVLESFATLVARHHTTFRSFQTQIRTVAIAALYNDPFDSGAKYILSSAARDAASQIVVLLHQCAQKGGGAAEWEKGIEELTAALHANADQVFRAVVEDWQSVTGERSTNISGEDLSDEPEMDSNAAGFPGWSGIRSGAEHLQTLLGLLKAYLTTPTAAPVKLPLGCIVDTLTRLLYVQVPRAQDQLGNRYNAQVTRTEREELWTILPNIHVSTMEVFFALAARLEMATLPLCSQFIDLIAWLFEAESSDTNIRIATYCCIAQILAINGPSLLRSTVESLDRIIKSCCNDLISSKVALTNIESLNTPMSNGSKSSKGTNGTILGAVSATSPTARAEHPGLHEAASTLLPALLARLSADLVPKASRTIMDRTAVLTQNNDALAASVLNPAPQKASILPLMSALTRERAFTEAILRPRMPIILNRKVEGVELDYDHEEKEEEEDEEEEAEGEARKENRDSNPAVSKSEIHRSWATDLARDQIKPVESDSIDVWSAGRIPTIKRGGDIDVDERATKRTRADSEAVSVASIRQKSTSTSNVLVPVTVGSVQAQMDSEDDDESDFEMPKLVMGEIDEDEEEHSEE